MQNYPNRFPDGRPAKSTSVGLRTSQGRCVAAVCLNLDTSALGAAGRMLKQMVRTGPSAPVAGSLAARSLEDVRTALDRFAAERGVQPRALAGDQRREAVLLLAERGLMRLRGAAQVASNALGISRTTLYALLRQGDGAAA